MASITIRIDDDTKAQAQRLFSALGMDLTTAITVFVKQSLHDNALPFVPSLNRPNAETLEALAEGDRLLADPNTKRYHTADELFDELDREIEDEV